MKEPFSEFKNLITATERYIQELSKSHGVEHLSGPQGWTVMFLKDNQGKEKAGKITVFLTDLKKLLLKDISQEDLSVARKVFKQIKQNLEKKE